MNSIDSVNPDAVKFALKKIKDGFTFESFAQQYMTQLLKFDFVPAGGIHDRGIDGLEHIFNRSGFELDIYQMSIEKGCVDKLEKTLSKLRENNIQYTRLTFVTNQPFPDKDVHINRLYDEYGKQIIIRDIEWFGMTVNSNEGTVRAYQLFAKKHLHAYQQPGQSFTVSNFERDPRLYVFLQQQFEKNHQNLGLDEILADTLILFSLEGTDPDKHVFMTEAEIKSKISTHIKFEPRTLFPVIERRLRILSAKPRRIKYHSKEKAYVLPYETRLEIQERNLKDASLHETFLQESETILRKHLKTADVKVKDVIALLESTFNKIFSQQGLEFADFVLRGENPTAIEKELWPMIDEVVDKSSVVPKNKAAVKTAVRLTVRDIVYNGTKEQKLFLQRLSNTYMMLFMLQCDPKLATYFYSMASKLRVYVCNSIIVPAMSEFYLDTINRRHWNLLVRAKQAGVKLIINDKILDELVYHLKKSFQQYKEEFEAFDEVFAAESQVLYIEPILIRAYYYEKMKRPTLSYKQFLDNFVPPDFIRAKESLLTWLEATFGIQYQSDSSLGITISAVDRKAIEEELTARKKNSEKAKNDASVILTIYALREKNCEVASEGIFGYKTWWLSKDIKTHEAVTKVAGNRYKTSCYIRPDFLYTYISLAPSPYEANEAFDGIFPTLLGINLSFNLPEGIISTVQKFLSDHRERLKNNPGRLKAILQELSTRLKSDPDTWTQHKVEHYLDDVLNEFTTGKLQQLSSGHMTK